MTTSSSATAAPGDGTRRVALSGADDDFATSKVPYHAKRSIRDFSALAMGAVTSIFVFAFGGGTALAYGLPVTIAMGLVGFVVGSIVAGIMAWHAAGNSMGVDLLSRGAGFGYLGAGFNVLLLGITWIAYAAFECAFIASAIHTVWPAVPLWVFNLVSAFVIVPLTWRGVAQVAWLQKITVPLFFAGVIYLFIVALGQPVQSAIPTTFTVSGFFQALFIPLSIVPILALALGDYGRFIRKSERRRVAPTGAVLMMGLWIIEFIGGAIITSRLGTANPGEYAVTLMGVIGLVWVLLTQMKVQFANYYGGSLSLANFATRLLRVRDLRRVFLVVVAIAAFVAAQLGVIDNLNYVAGLLGVVLSSWVSLMMVDLFQRRAGGRRFGITWVEHRRGHLRDWGIPEVLAMVSTSVLGIVLTVAQVPAGYAGTVSIALAWILTPVLAAVLRTVRPQWANVVRSEAPVGWRDEPGDDDRLSDDPARQVTCSTCQLVSTTIDSIKVDDTIECSRCDSARTR